jgi:hypothetical protein
MRGCRYCRVAELAGRTPDTDPLRFAIPLDRLHSVLEPLSSDVVPTIVGFTELAEGGRLYNAAAVFRRGSVVGV